MEIEDLEANDRVISFKQNLAIQELVDELRNKDTDPMKFRKGLTNLGLFMGYEISKTFDYEVIDIQTPVCPTRGIRILDKDNVVLINILRAAIPFIEGFYKVFPKARTGIISAWRGPAPESKIAVEYVKVPKTTKEDIIMIGDPMLATGHTISRIIDEVKNRGEFKRIMVVSVVSAPEGIREILAKHKDVEIITAVIDEKLNQMNYIIPGLGDAGDRCFGEPDKK
ncbi:MAG: uracil phosphoribosyltransferase [Candidatus Methanofastidiosa archaeon]|jgi:uracil phosphoribosyltransferase|nr:uracil phosphoribosyltransferase [Candidatus Methanofastidiosa archaeon]HOM96503.1 uracil phosphoribosyltransferase [Methanofastidiosum sp.]HRS26596.1 uracil phosphoribosyltransferase [Methanofastidiosum sp.]